MTRNIIIEKYGVGNAVIVFDRKKIVDLFVDPPSNSNFYPPNTFVKAKIQRRVSKRGGYFVSLPNGYQGFLKSGNDYNEGRAVVLLSKVFFDEDKPQIFTDKLKIISKFFILRLGDCGFSFSRKTSKNFDKNGVIKVLKCAIKMQSDIFIVCRSSITNINTKQFNEELERVLQHYKTIKEQIAANKEFYAGLAKKVALEKYDQHSSVLFEEKGIFERLGLWDQIDLFCKKKYPIRNGPNLILEQTSSFYAIDVNSGKDLNINVKELNLLATIEICRLIRILGLGGKIIVDFLPCSKFVKKQIFDFFVDFFNDDNSVNKIWGWTNGGAFELERERDKTPLKILINDNNNWTKKLT